MTIREVFGHTCIVKYLLSVTQSELFHPIGISHLQCRYAVNQIANLLHAMTIKHAASTFHLLGLLLACLLWD